MKDGINKKISNGLKQPIKQFEMVSRSECSMFNDLKLEPSYREYTARSIQII